MIRFQFECEFCSDKVINTTKLKEKLKLVYGDEMELLSPYVNARTKVRILHKPCKKERQVLPGTITRYKCPVCSKNNKKTTTEFKLEIKKLVGDEYEVLSEYNGVDKEIQLKHNKCGSIYASRPGWSLHGNKRCPKCAESKGEKELKNI